MWEKKSVSFKFNHPYLENYGYFCTNVYQKYNGKKQQNILNFLVTLFPYIQDDIHDVCAISTKTTKKYISVDWPHTQDKTFFVSF